MRRIILPLTLFCSFIASNGQEQLNHDKKIYHSPEGKLYIQRSLPVYLRLSTSPNDDAKSYLLKSEQTPKYSNPMYFDTEGWNTVRSPSAVDTSSLKSISPLQDIIFEVYADGIAPVTKTKFFNSKKIVKEDKIIYGKDLKIEFITFDEVSGVENMYYSINTTPYKPYSSELLFTEEKEYILKYYSVDYVGNVEMTKEKSFIIDLTPPSATYEISGVKNQKYLSSKSKIVLKSSDELSGVKAIYYSINNQPEKRYVTPISASILKSGDTEVTYYSVDNVGNKGEKKIISASSGINGGSNGEKSIYDFYVDDEAPVTDLEIVGDQYKGKYLFISERSRIKVNATDEKSGVDKIFYSKNTTNVNELYSEPFIPSTERFQKVYFYAIDFVENKSLVKSRILYLDDKSPVSNLVFVGNKFYNRDTLFITSNTKMKISAVENESGIQKKMYKINGLENNIYDKEFTIDKEGLYTINYYTSDNVNNIEEAKEISFVIDNTPPEIFTHFSVESIGEKTVREEKYVIYPSNSKFYIAATDNTTGGEKIEYRINGGKIFTKLPIINFPPGNYDIEITAYDVLKNKSQKNIKFSIEK